MSTVQIQTPLGTLQFHARAADGVDISDDEVQIFAIVPSLQLPEKMAVDGVAAVILIARPERRFEPLVFECIWRSPPCEGSPDCGEHLDACSWEHDGHIVTVGTEDFEALHSRLPYLPLLEEPYPIDFLRDGLRITIPVIEAGQEFSLHFVVAHNPLPQPDPFDCSTWFAVDIPHRQLLAELPQQNASQST